MAIKSKIWAFLSLIAILLSQKCSCDKSLGCSENTYSFGVSCKAVPDLDSIHINDTIWIILEESTQLVDQSSNKIVDYSGAQNLGTVVSCMELLGNSKSRDAADDLNVITYKGALLNRTSVDMEFKFVEENQKFHFKAGFIPTKKGVYVIGLSNAANVFTNKNKCTKAGFTINFKETDQHLYFNEWNYGVVVPLPNGGYCFKVN